MFTLLITGEGPADRRAITDSPQAQRAGNPANTHRCLPNVTAMSNCQRGSLHWQNPKAQREILKTWEELAELALTANCAWEVEVGSWGHRQSVIQSKVGLGQDTSADSSIHTHTHTLISLALIELHTPDHKSLNTKIHLVLILVHIWLVELWRLWTPQLTGCFWTFRRINFYMNHF